MAVFMAMPWHAGEEKMHKLMKVPEQDNPTTSMLTAQAANMLQRGPLIAVGTLDKQKRPWTTLWGGAAGLSQPLGNNMIGVRTPVDKKNDPVVDVLFGGNAEGEVVKEEGNGRMVSGLTIDLETRKRVKIYGRMVAGAVAPVKGEDEEGNEHETDQAQVQLVVRVDQSLGNCPKYLNRKQISPALTKSTLESSSAELSEQAREVIAKADLFFISSSNEDDDMDTNHRGGPAGFIRTAKNDSGKWDIVWPEYSGNRLYQTLGNLQTTPRAGLVIPEFETGNALYVTGETEVLIGPDAAKVIPHSNLAVRLTVAEARFVKEGLPFRGAPGESSPYNPKVRPLAAEGRDAAANQQPQNTATLLETRKITPTINRYRFSISNPMQSWKAGGWVALDFSDELDIGYSHMRDDDPQSINDDFVRTFTVSSPPAPHSKLSDDEFEVTIRNVGTVTNFLSRKAGGGRFEVALRGFGGEVSIEQEKDAGATTPFVAGGVGITPLLAQLASLDWHKLRIFWAVSVNDIDLVIDMLDRYEGVGKSLSLFLTGTTDESLAAAQGKVERIRQSGASVETRRWQKADLDVPGLSNRWNLCVNTTLRKVLLEWLPDKEVIFEDFNF